MIDPLFPILPSDGPPDPLRGAGDRAREERRQEFRRGDDGDGSADGDPGDDSAGSGSDSDTAVDVDIDRFADAVNDPWDGRDRRGSDDDDGPDGRLIDITA